MEEQGGVGVDAELGDFLELGLSDCSQGGLCQGCCNCFDVQAQGGGDAGVGCWLGLRELSVVATPS